MSDFSSLIQGGLDSLRKAKPTKYKTRKRGKGGRYEYTYAGEGKAKKKKGGFGSFLRSFMAIVASQPSNYMSEFKSMMSDSSLDQLINMRSEIKDAIEAKPEKKAPGEKKAPKKKTAKKKKPTPKKGPSEKDVLRQMLKAIDKMIAEKQGAEGEEPVKEITSGPLGGEAGDVLGLITQAQVKHASDNMDKILATAKKVLSKDGLSGPYPWAKLSNLAKRLSQETASGQARQSMSLEAQKLANRASSQLHKMAAKIKEAADKKPPAEGKKPSAADPPRGPHKGKSWDDIFSKYDKNEDINAHAENAVLLAEALGKPASNIKALKDLLARRDRNNGLDSDDIRQRAKLTEGHYKEAKKRAKAEGIAALDEIDTRQRELNAKPALSEKQQKLETNRRAKVEKLAGTATKEASNKATVLKPGDVKRKEHKTGEKAHKRAKKFQSTDTSYRVGMMQSVVMNVRGERYMVSTDGSRLAMIPVSKDVKEETSYGGIGYGDFPDVERVIPSTDQIEAHQTHHFDAKALLAQAKLAAYAPGRESGKVHFFQKDGKHSVQASTSWGDAPEGEEIQAMHGTAHVEASGVERAPEIQTDTKRSVLNAKFLVDALQGATGSVAVHYTGNDQMLHITRSDGEVHIIMPMRLDRGVLPQGHPHNPRASKSFTNFSDLLKAKPTKYLKRKRGKGGRYEYTYAEKKRKKGLFSGIITGMLAFVRHSIEKETPVVENMFEAISTEDLTAMAEEVRAELAAKPAKATGKKKTLAAKKKKPAPKKKGPSRREQLKKLLAMMEGELAARATSQQEGAPTSGVSEDNFETMPLTEGERMNVLANAKGRTVTIKRDQHGQGDVRKVISVRPTYGTGMQFTLDRPLTGKTSTLYTFNADQSHTIRVHKEDNFETMPDGESLGHRRAREVVAMSVDHASRLASEEPGTPLRAPHYTTSAQVLLLELDQAQGGILFLDQIEDFSLESIKKLAVAMRDKPYAMIGYRTTGTGTETDKVKLKARLEALGVSADNFETMPEPVHASAGLTIGTTKTGEPMHFVAAGENAIDGLGELNLTTTAGHEHESPAALEHEGKSYVRSSYNTDSQGVTYHEYNPERHYMSADKTVAGTKVVLPATPPYGHKIQINSLPKSQGGVLPEKFTDATDGPLKVLSHSTDSGSTVYTKDTPATAEATTTQTHAQVFASLKSGQIVEADISFVMGGPAPPVRGWSTGSRKGKFKVGRRSTSGRGRRESVTLMPIDAEGNVERRDARSQYRIHKYRDSGNVVASIGDLGGTLKSISVSTELTQKQRKKMKRKMWSKKHKDYRSDTFKDNPAVMIGPGAHEAMGEEGGTALVYLDTMSDEKLQLLHDYMFPQVAEEVAEVAEPEIASRDLSSEERQQTAKTILDQMGGQNRIAAMTGARNFVMIGGTGGKDPGVSFKFPNRLRSKPNHVKITLNGRDLYDIELGRAGSRDYKVKEILNDVFFEDLKPIFERATGLYLSLAQPANFSDLLKSTGHA